MVGLRINASNTKVMWMKAKKIVKGSEKKGGLFGNMGEELRRKGKEFDT